MIQSTSSAQNQQDILVPAVAAVKEILPSVSPQVIYGWLRDARLPSVKAGGRWFLRKSQIQDILQKGI